MSNKLTFEEWKRRLQDECYNSDCATECDECEFSIDKLSAWNFAQAQEQKEIDELHKANVALMNERDILRKENDSLWVENEDLTRKIEELKKKVEDLVKRNQNLMSSYEYLSSEYGNLDKSFADYRKENESLKKKLEMADEVIRFYGDPEKWMIKTSDHWTKSNPRTYGDSELIEDYSHPNKDWVGSIVVGGKKARAYLKENDG